MYHSYTTYSMWISNTQDEQMPEQKFGYVQNKVYTYIIYIVIPFPRQDVKMPTTVMQPPAANPQQRLHLGMEKHT